MREEEHISKFLFSMFKNYHRKCSKNHKNYSASYFQTKNTEILIKNPENKSELASILK